MKNEHIILAGAGTAALGTFLPVLTLPLGASVNYFKNGQGDGVLVLILSALVALFALTDLKRFSWIPAGLSLGVVTYSMVNVASALDQAKSNLERELAGNPFAGLATGLFETVNLEYGWFFLFLGPIVSLFGTWRSHLQTKEQSTSTIESKDEGENPNHEI